MENKIKKGGDKMHEEFKDFEKFSEWLGMPKGPDKSCALKQFMESLDFVKQNREFKIVDLQRYLQCGYGTAVKVKNALCALWVIEETKDQPKRFIRLMEV